MRCTFSRLCTLVPALALLLCCATSHAAVTLTIDSPNRTGTPGQTFLFQGTIANTNADPVSDADTFLNFGAYDPANVFVNLLLGSTPFTVSPGTASAMLDLFEVTIDPAAPLSTYSVDAFLQDQFGFDLSNTETVSINVVPEPATYALFGAVALALSGVRRRLR